MSTVSDRFGITSSTKANVDGTYPALRAQATTKADVGLSNVDNVSQAGYDGRYVKKTGDTVNGELTISKNTSATVTYGTGHLELRSEDGTPVSLGLHRSGFTACQIRHESNGLILSGTSQTNSANFMATGNVTAYSDVRLKENIELIPDALDKVTSLSGYTFDRIDDDTPRQTGVIAQELIKVLPEAVIGGPTEENPDGYYSVAYGNLVGLLIEAVKEERRARESLERRIDAMGC